jgi:pyruvate formate lyase activating enzyme
MDPRPEIGLGADRCLACGACRPVCAPGLAGPLAPGAEPPAAADGCTRCGSCVEACPAEARSLLGRPVGVEELLAELDRDGVYHRASQGGVTFSGGEPLNRANAPFVLECLAALRERGVPTAVDTCGQVEPRTLLAAADLADLVLFDLKIMDDQRHRAFTGRGTADIHANLRDLAAAGAPVRIRVPLIPGRTADPANLRAIARFVAELDAGWSVDLLPWHRTAADKYRRLGRITDLADLQPLAEEELDDLAALVRAAGLDVTCGGDS